MSASGAKVMMRCARSRSRAATVSSSASARRSCDGEGTWIGEEDELMLEKAIISGVTHDTSEAKVVDHRRARPAGRSPRSVFRALARRRREHRHDRAERLRRRRDDITFTLPKTDLPVAEPILDASAREIGATGVERDPEIAKISLIGAGMKSHPGVAADMFDALAEAGINIEIISTSSIRVSCVIRAVRGRARPSRRCTSGSGRSPRSVSVSDLPRIGVVGATGAVGTVTLELLRGRGYENVRVFASARSAGKQLGGFTVEEATPEALSRGDVDVFLFSVGHGRLARARAARRARRRGRDRQVVRLPARAGYTARRARGERGRARSSTTASSRTRTAARSRSPAC